MSDAKVISMDGDRPRTPGARSVLLGADRASGERARRRRRTTPLLSGPPAEIERIGDESPPVEPVEPVVAPIKRVASAAKKSPAKKSPAKQSSAKKAAAGGASADQAAAKQAADGRRPPKRTATKRVSTKRVSASPIHPVAPADPTEPAEPAEPTDPMEPVEPVQNVEPPEPAEPIGPAFESLVPPVDEPVPTGGRHSIAKALVAQAGEALLDALVSRARPADLEAKVAAVLTFLGRRLTGEYELDDFGFDAEFAEAVPLLLLRPLYRHWFRVEVRGIENLPRTGGALIVANHSGAIPIDALMASVAVHEEHPEHRFLRTLGADLVFQTPFLAGLARRSGATLASNPDAERLLSDGHLVGVWPEGFKGIGKPFTERYKLQRFGRGGFVSAALRTGTPIIPCSIVGAEETYPIIGNVPSLARLLGLPYLPITPFFPLLGPLGAIPLPSKWLIEFGTPVVTHDYEPGAAEDPMLVFDLTDQIRQSIQQTLYSLLVQRRSIFF